jgi:hypothetical protein
MLNVEVGDAVLMIFESGAGPADLAPAERTVPSPADGDCFGSPKPHPAERQSYGSVGTARSPPPQSGRAEAPPLAEPLP